MAASYYASKGFVNEIEAERFTLWAAIGVAVKDPRTGRFEGPWISRGDHRRRASDRVLLVSVAVQAWIYSEKSITEAAEIVANSRLWKERAGVDGRGRKREVRPGERINKAEPWRQAETVRTLYHNEKAKHGDRLGPWFDFHFGMYLAWRAWTRIRPADRVEPLPQIVKNAKDRNDLCHLIGQIRRDGPEAEFDNPHAQGILGSPDRPELYQWFETDSDGWMTIGESPAPEPELKGGRPRVIRFR